MFPAVEPSGRKRTLTAFHSFLASDRHLRSPDSGHLAQLNACSPCALACDLARTFKQLFPGRFAVAGVVVVTYLAVSLAHA